ncbi:Cytochrome P450 [Dillenia turbinata]|uniref:Cytochrome P450 n=1 Tax=Dillenia turbinata TaxID=194707 RepID=A0AAN8VU43_9MAGN
MDFLSSILWLFLAWALIQGLLSAIKARNRKLPLPPGPIPYPIVGNLFKLGDKPHKSLAKLAKIHGPIMSVKLGQITTIVISSPALAKEVLQTNDLNFSYRAFPECTKAHNHHINSMVWLPPAKEWRNLRKLSNSQIFSARTLDANQHLRQQKVAELLEYVQECSKAGLPVDIGRAAFVTSLNLLSNTVFSADLVNPRSDSAQEFKDLTWDIMEEIAKPNLADYFPVLRSIDPQGRKCRLGSLFGKMFDIFNNLIEQRLQSIQAHGSHSNTGTDVLDILLGIIAENKEIDRTMLLHLFLGAGSKKIDMDDKFGITLQKSKPLLAVPVKA